VGSEKEFCFEWGRALVGKAHGQEASQRRMETCARANRCANRVSAPSNVRVNDSILSDAARCRVDVAVTATMMGQRLAGNAARRKASWVVPPFSPQGEKLSSRGENGGTILVRRVKPTTRIVDGARGGSCRSAWNRPGGARGRQGTSEDGTISVKAPPAVALGRPSAGGQHPERREALPYRKARVRLQR
jgi:hypothetical protein